GQVKLRVQALRLRQRNGASAQAAIITAAPSPTPQHPFKSAATPAVEAPASRYNCLRLQQGVFPHATAVPVRRSSSLATSSIQTKTAAAPPSLFAEAGSQQRPEPPYGCFC
uniref:Uncharacterized protein n=1 Tax=Macrostomum lignano TaxID=282301 RepID=A0A1I8F9K7_9PLAT